MEWNATSVAYPREASIHSLFAEQVARTPDTAAVEFEGARLTYRELEARSNQLAHHMVARGVAPGALALERLSQAEDGRIAWRMKRPLPDGTWHLCFTGVYPFDIFRGLAIPFFPPT